MKEFKHKSFFNDDKELFLIEFPTGASTEKFFVDDFTTLTWKWPNKASLEISFKKGDEKSE